jgi:hypothetical protein
MMPYLYDVQSGEKSKKTKGGLQPQGVDEIALRLQNFLRQSVFDLFRNLWLPGAQDPAVQNGENWNEKVPGCIYTLRLLNDI